MKTVYDPPFIPIEEVPGKDSITEKTTFFPEDWPGKTTQSSINKQAVPKPAKPTEVLPLKLGPKLLVTTYGVAKLKNISVERYIQQALRKENEQYLKAVEKQDK